MNVNPSSLTGTGSCGNITACDKIAGCRSLGNDGDAIGCMLEVCNVCKVGVCGEEKTAASCATGVVDDITLPWVDVQVAVVEAAKEVRALMLTVPPPDWTDTGGQMN